MAARTANAHTPHAHHVNNAKGGSVEVANRVYTHTKRHVIS